MGRQSYFPIAYIDVFFFQNKQLNHIEVVARKISGDKASLLIALE